MESINAISALLSKISLAVGLLSVAAAQMQPITYTVTPTPKPDIWEGYQILRKVAACEDNWDVNSEPRQFNSDGSPLWGWDAKLGKVVQRDVGIAQINVWVHGEEIKKLGLDVIHSERDNIQFAKILFDREGLRPWLASRACWSGQDNVSKAMSMVSSTSNTF